MTYSEVVNQSCLLLKSNPEWISRYKKYITLIMDNEEKIKNLRDSFYRNTPLKPYLTVSGAKKRSSIEISLRYYGTRIATVKKNKNVLIVKPIQKNSSIPDYDYSLFPKEFELNSNEGTNFKKLFIQLDKEGKRPIKDEEHQLESILLDDFAKKSSKEKLLNKLGIQPITMLDTDMPFQMPTPLSASEIKENKLDYSGAGGGGIDIMARIKGGHGCKLSIIEIKDEYNDNENPSVAINQAIAYATFIEHLLRSEKANNEAPTWKKFFGLEKRDFNKNGIKLNAVVIMPWKENPDVSFIQENNAPLHLNEEFPNDLLYLHCILLNDGKNPTSVIYNSLERI